MRADIQRLIQYINRKDWWHVMPVDPSAYKKRGKFLASSFAEAEFYGRPNDEPEKLMIAAPIVGDNDTIERKLIGRVQSRPDMSVRERLVLDARLRRAALEKGYDSIALMSPKGFRAFRKEGKIPRSLELNVLDLQCCKASSSMPLSSRL